MIAAQIWHWWLGLAMLIVGIGATLGLVVIYLKVVVSQQHPSSRVQEEQDL